MGHQLGRKFRPSNGTDGMMFEAAWCDACARQGKCIIHLRAMLYSLDDPAYPDQWTYDASGSPVCTGFRDAQAEKQYEFMRKQTQLEREGQMRLFA